MDSLATHMICKGDTQSLQRLLASLQRSIQRNRENEKEPPPPSRLDQLFPSTFSNLLDSSPPPITTTKSKPSTPVTKVRRTKPQSKDELSTTTNSTQANEGFFGYFSNVLKQGLASVTGSTEDQWANVDIKEEAEKMKRQLEKAEAARREKYKRQAMAVTIDGKSEIIDSQVLKKLLGMTPDRYHLNAWQLLYSITRDGVSFSRFFERVGEIAGTVIIIRDTHNNTFGGYAPSPWVKDSTEIYYGTGEAFVYRIQGSDVLVYNWSGKNDFYMLSSKKEIAMGGGGSFAWSLDTDFRNGSSGDCQTFLSPCLAGSHDFMCVMLEVWGASGDMVGFDD